MTAATAAVLLAACSVGEAPLPVQAPAPGGPAPRVVAPEWRAIPVEGVISDVDGTYTELLTVVGTARDGRPLVAAVDGDHLTQVASKVPDAYGTGATSATGNVENDGFVQQAAPALGLPARLFLGYIDPEYGDGLFEEWHRSTLVHPDGAPTPWASLLLDDEGDVRAVGARREHGAWRAHLWEAHPDDGRWRLTERGPGPRLRAEPSARTLVTSTEEVRVYVAENAAARARLWSIDADPYHPTRWRSEDLEGGADTVTDVLSWAVGSWVAGTREDHAVVWDLDHVGGEVDLPDVELDPGSPLVRVLRLPIGDQQPAVAVQQPDGPSVWVRAESGWRELEAPPGRMSLAAATAQGLYLVIDGELWFRPLPWDSVLP